MPFAGHPLALYAALRERARAGHGAVVFTGAHWILSFSPELFFTLEQAAGHDAADEGHRAARRTAGADAAAVAELAARPQAARRKSDDRRPAAQRSVAGGDAGQVKVPELFEVETYPTVHQMISTVTAELERRARRGRRDPGDLPVRLDHRRAQDPGDGDHRANENAPRGVYCGAIGRIAPDGDAAFNVAIRTLMMRDGEAMARLGLGSGIVADSRRAGRMARMPGEGSVRGDAGGAST